MMLEQLDIYVKQNKLKNFTSKYVNKQTNKQETQKDYRPKCEDWNYQLLEQT